MSAKQMPRVYPWLIWILSAGFFFAEYFARIAPAVMVPQLMAAFNVAALGIGSLSGFFYYAYVSMQIPVGALVDRFGPHRLLTLMAGLCAFACFIFAVADNIAWAHFARLLMGFSAAFAFVGTLKLASEWFPPERFGLLAGMTQAIGMLGASLALGPLAIAVEVMGWRSATASIGVVLLMLALLIGLIVRDRPESALRAAAKTLFKEKNLWHGLLIVIKNPQSWWNALFVGLLYAPTAAFGELWGVSYLVRTHDLSRGLAADAVSTIFIGWALGGPLLGWISDRIGKRRPVMIFSAVASFFFMSGVLYLPHLSSVMLFVLLFLYGISNTGVATSYAVAAEINPRAVSGVSMAFANMASVLIGAIFQPVIGWLLVLQWQGVIKNGIPFYEPAAYRYAMLALPICLLLSLVVCLFLKETHCRIKHFD